MSHVLFWLLGLCATVLGLQVVQWVGLWYYSAWPAIYGAVASGFQIVPCLLAIFVSVLALINMGPSTNKRFGRQGHIKAGFLPVIFLALGSTFALLDFRPADLPDRWRDAFGQTQWVYGQVKQLPKTMGQQTSFVFQSLCWQSQEKPLALGGSKTMSPVFRPQSSSHQYRITNAAMWSGRARRRCQLAGTPVPAYFNRLKVIDYSGRSQAIKPGQWAWLPLKIKAPRGQINPGGGDAERWYFVNRIGANANVISSLEPIWLGQTWSVDTFRDQVSAWLQNKLVPYPAASRLLPALLIGDRRALTQADWTQLNRLGLGHLVAISGLHVGFAASFGFLFGQILLRGVVVRFPIIVQLRPLHCWAWLCAWSVGAAYSLLAGFSLPTVRALLMLSIFCLWRWFFQNQSLLRAWVFAGAFLLGLSPRWLFDTSFLLSFGATGLLVTLLGERHFGQDKFRQAWRLQWGLALGLIPLNLAFFQQVSWISPFINFVLVPLVGFVAVPVLLIGVVVSLFWDAGGVFVLKLVALPINEGFRGLAYLAQNASVANQWLVRSPIAWTALFGAVLFWLLPKAWRLRPMAGVMLLVGCLYQAAPSVPEGGFRLTVLDVGQGLAVGIETHNHFMVYDAGPAFGASNQVQRSWMPFMRYHRLTHIDLLLSSHMDRDHAGSAAALISAVPVSAQMGLMPIVAQVQPEFRPCQAGAHWHWDGVDFEILFPTTAWLHKGKLSRPVRNVSCVLKITGAKHSALLPGDIDVDMEQALLRQKEASILTNTAMDIKMGTNTVTSKNTVHADLLLVPHHGSKSSSSSGLLNHVAPRWAVASYGFGNGFGHPHPDVMQRYQRRDISWLSTAQSGALSFVSDPSTSLGFSIEQWRLKRARLWRHGLRDSSTP